MKYTEEIGDLFELGSEYSKVQCISLDCAMGAGIAVEFCKRYPGMKEYCMRVIKQNNLSVPCIVPYISDGEIIFNLVTKKLRWHKPTYHTMFKCIEDLAYLSSDFFKVKHLAMPAIGCGLDKLDWGIVSREIKREFKNKDIDITVRLN